MGLWGIIQLERTFRDRHVQPPDLFRANQKVKPATEGIIQPPLDPCQAVVINHHHKMPMPVFDHPQIKKFFLMSSLSLPWHSSVLFLPSVLREQSPAPAAAVPSSRGSTTPLSLVSLANFILF